MVSSDIWELVSSEAALVCWCDERPKGIRVEVRITVSTPPTEPDAGAGADSISCERDF